MRDLVSRGRVSIRRRSAASIIAFLFLFAALYSAGVGFFLFVNSDVQSLGQADASAARVAQQASLEKLNVAAHLNGTGNLYLSVNNTGGVSTTILEAYVACNSKCPGGVLPGQLVSTAQGTSSHYLTSLTDLNVTLPITLPIGTSTHHDGLLCGAAKGCDIAIKKGAFTFSGLGEVVVASVLTSNGNVFSAQYPPPPLPSTVYTIVSSQSTISQIQESGGGPLIAMQIVAS